MPSRPSTANRPIRTGDYRIRWAIVSHGNGHRLSRERMCIAERKGWIGWWSIADWRFSEADALADIEHYRALSVPLPRPKLIA